MMFPGRLLSATIQSSAILDMTATTGNTLGVVSGTVLVPRKRRDCRYDGIANRNL